MLPTSEEGAVGALILEALRGLNESIASQNAASTEDRKLLHDMHGRLIRMESVRPDVDGHDLKELASRVDALERDKDRRDGATSLADWLFKSPVVGWIVAALVVIAGFWARDQQI
jgi:hypothetical protein